MSKYEELAKKYKLEYQNTPLSLLHHQPKDSTTSNNPSKIGSRLEATVTEKYGRPNFQKFRAINGYSPGDFFSPILGPSGEILNPIDIHKMLKDAKSMLRPGTDKSKIVGFDIETLGSDFAKVAGKADAPIWISEIGFRDLNGKTVSGLAKQDKRFETFVNNALKKLEDGIALNQDEFRTLKDLTKYSEGATFGKGDITSMKASSPIHADIITTSDLKKNITNIKQGYRELQNKGSTVEKIIQKARENGLLKQGNYAVGHNIINFDQPLINKTIGNVFDGMSLVDTRVVFGMTEAYGPKETLESISRARKGQGYIQSHNVEQDIADTLEALTDKRVTDGLNKHLKVKTSRKRKSKKGGTALWLRVTQELKLQSDINKADELLDTAGKPIDNKYQRLLSPNSHVKIGIIKKERVKLNGKEEDMFGVTIKDADGNQSVIRRKSKAELEMVLQKHLVYDNVGMNPYLRNGFSEKMTDMARRDYERLFEISTNQYSGITKAEKIYKAIDSSDYSNLSNSEKRLVKVYGNRLKSEAKFALGAIDLINERLGGDANILARNEAFRATMGKLQSTVAEDERVVRPFEKTLNLPNQTKKGETTISFRTQRRLENSLHGFFNQNIPEKVSMQGQSAIEIAKRNSIQQLVEQMAKKGQLNGFAAVRIAQEASAGTAPSELVRMIATNLFATYKGESKFTYHSTKAIVPHDHFELNKETGESFAEKYIKNHENRWDSKGNLHGLINITDSNAKDILEKNFLDSKITDRLRLFKETYETRNLSAQFSLSKTSSGYRIMAAISSLDNASNVAQALMSGAEPPNAALVEIGAVNKNGNFVFHNVTRTPHGDMIFDDYNSKVITRDITDRYFDVVGSNTTANKVKRLVDANDYIGAQRALNRASQGVATSLPIASDKMSLGDILKSQILDLSGILNDDAIISGSLGTDFAELYKGETNSAKRALMKTQQVALMSKELGVSFGRKEHIAEDKFLRFGTSPSNYLAFGAMDHTLKPNQQQRLSYEPLILSHVKQIADNSSGRIGINGLVESDLTHDTVKNRLGTNHVYGINVQTVHINDETLIGRIKNISSMSDDDILKKAQELGIDPEDIVEAQKWIAKNKSYLSTAENASIVSGEVKAALNTKRRHHFDIDAEHAEEFMQNKPKRLTKNNKEFSKGHKWSELATGILDENSITILDDGGVRVAYDYVYSSRNQKLHIGNQKVTSHVAPRAAMELLGGKGTSVIMNFEAGKNEYWGDLIESQVGKRIADSPGEIDDVARALNSLFEESIAKVESTQIIIEHQKLIEQMKKDRFRSKEFLSKLLLEITGSETGFTTENGDFVGRSVVGGSSSDKTTYSYNQNKTREVPLSSKGISVDTRSILAAKSHGDVIAEYMKQIVKSSVSEEQVNYGRSVLTSYAELIGGHNESAERIQGYKPFVPDASGYHYVDDLKNTILGGEPGSIKHIQLPEKIAVKLGKDWKGNSITKNIDSVPIFSMMDEASSYKGERSTRFLTDMERSIEGISNNLFTYESMQQNAQAYSVDEINKIKSNITNSVEDYFEELRRHALSNNDGSVSTMLTKGHSSSGMRGQLHGMNSFEKNFAEEFKINISRADAMNMYGDSFDKFFGGTEGTKAHGFFRRYPISQTWNFLPVELQVDDNLKRGQIGIRGYTANLALADFDSDMGSIIPALDEGINTEARDRVQKYREALNRPDSFLGEKYSEYEKKGFQTRNIQRDILEAEWSRWASEMKDGGADVPFYKGTGGVIGHFDSIAEGIRDAGRNFLGADSEAFYRFESKAYQIVQVPIAAKNKGMGEAIFEIQEALGYSLKGKLPGLEPQYKQKEIYETIDELWSKGAIERSGLADLGWDDTFKGQLKQSLANQYINIEAQSDVSGKKHYEGASRGREELKIQNILNGHTDRLGNNDLAMSEILGNEVPNRSGGNRSAIADDVLRYSDEIAEAAIGGSKKGLAFNKTGLKWAGGIAAALAITGFVSGTVQKGIAAGKRPKHDQAPASDGYYNEEGSPGNNSSPMARITPDGTGYNRGMQIRVSGTGDMQTPVGDIMEQVLGAGGVNVNMNVNYKDNTRKFSQKDLQEIIAQAIR